MDSTVGIKDFEDKFSPLLGDTARWKAFHLIAEFLLNKNNPINIIETGCVWTADWKGQGCSTIVWKWLIDARKGSLKSLDINEEHLKKAKAFCPNTEPLIEFIQGDSIKNLIEIDLSKTDLLFLDSYDHNPPYGLSELHAVGELSVCYERLPSGCLIAVDDCHVDQDSGKHNFINVFFKRMGIEPLLKSYMYVWKKP